MTSRGSSPRLDGAVSLMPPWHSVMAGHEVLEDSERADKIPQRSVQPKSRTAPSKINTCFENMLETRWNIVKAGEPVGGSGRACGRLWRSFGRALGGSIYIEKLPINRTSGRYVTIRLIRYV